MPLEDVPPSRNEENEAHGGEETCPRRHVSWRQSQALAQAPLLPALASLHPRDLTTEDFNRQAQRLQKSLEKQAERLSASGSRLKGVHPQLGRYLQALSSREQQD